MRSEAPQSAQAFIAASRATRLASQSSRAGGGGRGEEDRGALAGPVTHRLQDPIFLPPNGQY